MSNEKKSQPISIFSLKLKAPNRNVKPQKIEKILKALYDEKDHTQSLRNQLLGFYTETSNTSGYLLYLSSFDDFINKFKNANIKKELDFEKTNTLNLIKTSLQLNAEDVLPNTQELNYLVETLTKNNDIKTSNPKIKEIILKTYLNKSGSFPTKKDFIKECYTNQIDNNDLEIFSKLSFETDNLLNITDKIFSETQCYLIWEKIKQSLESEYEVHLYGVQLYYLNLYENIRNSFWLAINNLKADARFHVSINYRENSVSSVEIKRTILKNSKLINKRSLNLLELAESFEMPMLLKNKIKELIFNTSINKNELRFNSKDSAHPILLCEDYKKYTLAFFKYLKEKGAVFHKKIVEVQDKDPMNVYQIYLDPDLKNAVKSISQTEVEKVMDTLF